MPEFLPIFRRPSRRDWWVAAAAGFLVIAAALSWDRPQPASGLDALHSRIQILLWDDTWRAFAGRNLPSGEDWVEIFSQLEKRGVRRVAIVDEQVFSPVNAATPGFLNAFRGASAKGILVYAPVSFAGELRRTSHQSVDPDLFGMPVERLLGEGGQEAGGLARQTSVLDYRMFADAAGNLMSGPSPGFAEFLAGVGLLESGDSPGRFFPAMRWREDRLLTHMGVVVLDEKDGMALDRGQFKLSGRPLQLDGGALLLPDLPGDATLRARSRSLLDLTGQAAASALDLDASTIVFLSGPGLAGARSAIGITNAALKGELRSPDSALPLSVIFVVMIMSFVAALMRSRAASTLVWLVVVANVTLMVGAGILWRSSGPGTVPVLLLAWTMPWGLVMAANLRRESALSAGLRRQLDNVLAEKISMSRQARMLVHDLRRVLKVTDPASRTYVDGFLAELSALDRESKPVRKAVSLVSLTGQSMAQIASLWSSRQIRYEIEFKHSALVIGDPAGIRRIIDNLLDNASAASPAGAVVKVRTADARILAKDSHRPACSLVVQNESAVLGQDKIARMSRAPAPGAGGRGLGLVIVRNLVESMGGEFRITESTPEGGDRNSSLISFEVLLPCDPQMVDPGAVQNMTGPGVPGVRYTRKLLIVVDDSPFIREAWEAQASDVEIVTFAFPEDFLAAYRDGQEFNQRSVILVSDYHFDGSAMDGVSLAREARRLGIKDVIICSDWELGALELRGTPVKLLKKDKISVAAVLEAIQNPSA
ncbi:MAG: hypothetical protein RIQ81_1942 [Pseudomonadota bacterium]